jgi:fermentation-respiration switch protein FrsA (DUF1100 family)
VKYDPRPALKKVKCPVLAINGEKDLQVPPKENLKAIRTALKEGENSDFTIKELKNLNHLFQTAKTGSPSEYINIEETISPVALKVIGDWIIKKNRITFGIYQHRGNNITCSTESYWRLDHKKSKITIFI